MANAAPEILTSDPAVSSADLAAGVAPHVDPMLLGLAPYQWVSIAMLTLLLIAIFGAKVHKTIGGGLDNRIAAIRDQLDEAKKLRAEAEALRDEYAAKIADAQKDAEAMLANARTEADAVMLRAEEDSAEMVARRQRMAEDKIAAAEREAIRDVRNRAAQAATGASRKLIAEQHDAAKDRALADEIIGGL